MDWRFSMALRSGWNGFGKRRYGVKNAAGRIFELVGRAYACEGLYGNSSGSIANICGSKTLRKRSCRRWRHRIDALQSATNRTALAVDSSWYSQNISLAASAEFNYYED
jgi:hypothetical protein